MSIQGFAEWLATPQGQYVRAWEQAHHDQLVSDIFGFNALQLGWPGLDYLRANRMPWRFCGDDRDGGAQLRTDLHHLPLASNSLDLVVLPHVLEFDHNPHQILREVERVLVPEGSVIVTGFNPISLWGLRRALSRLGKLPPFGGRYISVPRLKDWFALLGLEPYAGAFGCYAPAFSQEKWLARFAFMDATGDRWWPVGGAVYIIQAIKRQAGMRMLTPVWSDRKAKAKALLPVTRQTNNRWTGQHEQ